MRLLLDTHVFLWWLINPSKIDPAARSAIGDPANLVYVSSIVVWEMMIKQSVGKLVIPDDLDEALAHERFIHLPITIAHARAVATLPPIHRDPFDRMLVAQANVEGLQLVTRDPLLAGYPVAILQA